MFAEQNVQVGNTKLGIYSKIKKSNICPDIRDASTCEHYYQNLFEKYNQNSWYSLCWIQGNCSHLCDFRVDYCNVLLYVHTLHILCSVQDYAARLMQIDDCEHITPVLYYLHFLPVYLRINYKLLLYIYKALPNHVPPSICGKVATCKPRRQFRSSSRCLLYTKRLRCL